MVSVFIVCATLGGTILVLQFLMLLIGLGGHAFDLTDVPHDMGSGFGGDFHGDAGGGFHGDASAGHPASDHSTTDQAAHDTTWLFRVLSFRAVVAALTFFGLAGLAADSSGMPAHQTLLIAGGAGALALAAVYWMMRGISELRAEGTVQIHRAMGQCGTVYIRIPANNSDSGKIQINLQNRTMEYLAVTSGPELPSGAKVVVIGVVDPTTLEVEACE